MSARDELFLRITETERLKPSGADELLDAYRAEVLAESGEAWPGELDHLRALVATLTTAAEAGDLTGVQKQLAAYQRIDARRRTEQYAANGGGR